MNLYGNAPEYDDTTGGVNGSGVLKLTEAVGSQSGTAIIDDFDSGTVVGGFDVSFDLNIGEGNGADGFAFSFGDFADAAFGEEGPGDIAGLTISFDVYNNATGGGIPEAPAIDLKWNNVILSHRLVGAASTTTGAQPIGSATTIRTQTTAGGAPVYWPVKIHVDTDGTLDLSYNNVVIFTNVPVFRAITDITRGPAARFAFGARTGGSYDAHYIDNLKITTVPEDSKSGQPTAISLTPISLASAGAGAPASAVGGAIMVLQDATNSVNTNTIKLLYNNAAVTPTITRTKSSPDAATEDQTTISYFGANGINLPTGVGTVTLSYYTTGNPAVSNSFSYTFVTVAPAFIPTNWAVSGVDLTKPGFKARVYQMDTIRAPGDQNITQNGERQLAHGYIDPATGLPFPDISSLDPSLLDANGYFDIPGVINFEQAGLNAGQITGASNPPRQEELFPGILTENADNFAFEFDGFLHLAPGSYRLGFYADDRVRVSFGPSFQTVGTPVLLATTGANQENFVDLVVAQDGYYPLRVGYWEGGGGASVEIYSVDKNTNQKILLNDPELPSIQVYREATGSRPSISRVLPVENWQAAFPNDDVIVDIIDGAIPVAANSTALRINGVDQTITTTKTNNTTTIRRAGSVDNLLPPGLNNVQIIYAYVENGATVTTTNSYTFNVAPYYNAIPAANKVAASDVNTGETGFHARYLQLDRSGTTAQGDNGRIAGGSDQNRMPNPEIQLISGELNVTNGLPYANVADPGPNGNFTADFDLFNFKSPADTGEPGMFTTTAPAAAIPGGGHSDDVMPGLPGSAVQEAGHDNYVMEATTYLDLKKGVYVFGMNSDDGFVINSGLDPHDTLGTLLGFADFGRGSATSLTTPTLQAGQTYPLVGGGTNAGSTTFSVVVPEDGIYPFRLLYWQGGGGVNAEFFTLNKDNGHVLLVNDTASDASAVPAYRTYTGPARPWTEFSVSPTPWDNAYQQAGPGPITMVGRTVNSVASADIYNWSGTNRPWADVRIGGVITNASAENVALLLDGAAVAADKTASGSSVTVSYKPNPPLPSGSTHTASLVYGGTTNSWNFTVQTYTNLNASDAQPIASADASSKGFKVKVVQSATARTGANSGNNVPAAEAQLAGTPANVATNGPAADGSYIFPGIINWNNNMNTGGNKAGIGNFQNNVYGTGWPFPSYTDDPIPGVPGTGVTGTLNIAAEIFAYLEFDAPGYYRLGVNGDDGWAVKVGTPGVTNGTVLFATVDRGSGSADIPFSISVPQAGLYPIRLVWYQGGGGANVEFFSYDDNGNKIPINDPNNPNAIKAFYALGGNSGAPEITITGAANGQLTITWTNGGTLQSSPVIGTGATWTDVNSTGTFTTTATGNAMFFRVRK